MPSLRAIFRDYLLRAEQRFETAARITGNFLLLDDGVSFLLLDDGVSKLIIRDGSSVQTALVTAQRRDYILTAGERE